MDAGRFIATARIAGAAVPRRRVRVVGRAACAELGWREAGGEVSRRIEGVNSKGHPVGVVRVRNSLIPVGAVERLAQLESDAQHGSAISSCTSAFLVIG
jgi:hypothetical protein